MSGSSLSFSLPSDRGQSPGGRTSVTPRLALGLLRWRAERGFDFLGYRLSPRGLAVARQTWQRFAERAARLYEQERAGRSPPGALGAYVRRWLGWAGGGMAACGGVVELTAQGGGGAAQCRVRLRAPTIPPAQDRPSREPC